MIAVKDYSTDHLYGNLKDAIRAAAEYGIYNTIAVQKYYDDDSGVALWDVSFLNDIWSRRFLHLVEESSTIAMFRNCDSLEEESRLIDQLASLIDLRWNDDWNLTITTTHYDDEYEMYGLPKQGF